MKLLAAVTAFLFAASPVAAQEYWQIIETADTAALAVETASARGNGRAMLGAVVYPYQEDSGVPAGWTWLGVEIQVDCATGKVAVTAVQRDPAAPDPAFDAAITEFAQSGTGDYRRHACEPPAYVFGGFSSLEQLRTFTGLRQDLAAEASEGRGNEYSVLSLDPYNWFVLDVSSISAPGDLRRADYYTVWPGNPDGGPVYGGARMEVDCVNRRVRQTGTGSAMLYDDLTFRTPADTAWRGLDNHHDLRLVHLLCDGRRLPNRLTAIDPSAIYEIAQELTPEFYRVAPPAQPLRPSPSIAPALGRQAAFDGLKESIDAVEIRDEDGRVQTWRLTGTPCAPVLRMVWRGEGETNAMPLMLTGASVTGGSDGGYHTVRMSGQSVGTFEFSVDGPARLEAIVAGLRALIVACTAS